MAEINFVYTWEKTLHGYLNSVLTKKYNIKSKSRIMAGKKNSFKHL